MRYPYIHCDRNHNNDPDFIWPQQIEQAGTLASSAHLYREHSFPKSKESSGVGG
jgi:hypothetical protein